LLERHWARRRQRALAPQLQVRRRRRRHHHGRGTSGPGLDLGPVPGPGPGLAPTFELVLGLQPLWPCWGPWRVATGAVPRQLRQAPLLASGWRHGDGSCSLLGSSHRCHHVGLALALAFEPSGRAVAPS
jgi:hypothetical protein